MANVVVVTLSLSIGLFFILIGTIKLSPIINADVYKEMVILNYVYSLEFSFCLEIKDLS